MISVKTNWLFVTFSSINLSMEHIERSHLTNRLPNFHRSLTLYHDFFLHERCGAKIIEHPLAEWSVEWPNFCLDRWPDKKKKKKKKKERKKKKSHSTALYFKNHSADINHTCKTIMFLRSKDLNKNLLPPILIVL